MIINMTKDEERIEKVNNMIAILDEFLKRGYYVHSGPFMLEAGVSMNDLSKEDLIIFLAEGDRWLVNNEKKYVIVTN